MRVRCKCNNGLGGQWVGGLYAVKISITAQLCSIAIYALPSARTCASMSAMQLARRAGACTYTLQLFGEQGLARTYCSCAACRSVNVHPAVVLSVLREGTHALRVREMNPKQEQTRISGTLIHLILLQSRIF